MKRKGGGGRYGEDYEQFEEISYRLDIISINLGRIVKETDNFKKAISKIDKVSKELVDISNLLDESISRIEGEEYER